jgi:hypothetical protein
MSDASALEALVKPTQLPPGNHPGFAKLKSEPGVFRCKLRLVTNKAKPEFADYQGTLCMDNGIRASAMVWIHADGSIGLRLEPLKSTA